MADLRVNRNAVVICSLRDVSKLPGGAKTLLTFLITLFFFLLPLSLAAQESAQGEVNIKAADTSSPRDTLRSFIDACNELQELISTSKYFDRTDPKHLAIIERALDCIDESNLAAFARTERASEIAACLKEILDRVELPTWEEIPDTAAIKAAGGFESLTQYRIPDTRITIARVADGPRKHEYLFSPGTADRATSYFRGIVSKPYRTDGPPISKDFYRWYISAPGHPGLAAIVDGLPDFLRLRQTWGLANWKWLGLGITLLVAIPLMSMIYRAYFHLNDRARQRNLFLYWLTIGFPIAGVLIPLAVKYVATRFLTLRGTPLYILDFVAVLTAILAALLVIFAVSDRIAATIIASPRINPAGLNAQLIRIVAKLTSLVAAVLLFLFGGQYLGIPIGTLLASAGIGGVAVALGAQDSLKTLFGTLNLLADRPFRVGDRIIFDNYDGVVEDIGLRSTRVRLLNSHQITVPNDKLSGNDIENVGRRKFMRRVGEFHIPLDTECEKLEQAVAIINDELDDHEGMDPEHPPRVFFDEFNSDAYTIKFYYWYAPPDFWSFKEFGDKLNFRIFRKFEAAGIQFSFPFRHSFWKHKDEQGPLDVNVVDDKTKE